MITAHIHQHSDEIRSIMILDRSNGYFFKLVSILMHIDCLKFTSSTLLSNALRILTLGTKIKLNHFGEVSSEAIIKFLVNLGNGGRIFHFPYSLLYLLFASIEICCHDLSNIFSVLIYFNGDILCLRPIK